MDLVFDSRLPAASLRAEAQAHFERAALTGREEASGGLVFQGPAGTVRVALVPGDDGATRVTVSTEQLPDVVAAFRARVAPPAGGPRGPRRYAQMHDLERYRRMAERQAPPPASSQSRSASVGGGLMPGA